MNSRVLRAIPAAVLAVLMAACDNDGDQVTAPGSSPTADSFALTTTNRLVSFRRAAPAVLSAQAISGLQAGENIVGIDIRPGGATPGRLYALGSTGRLYTINTSTGAATLATTLAADPADSTSPFAALDGTAFGIDFNPVPDRLRVVSNTGQNLRINVDTGATITDTTLTLAGATATGVTAAAYTNAFAAACRTTLYYLDTTTDRLLTAADPNSGVVSVVGNLGVDGGAVNAFDVDTNFAGANSAFAVLTVAGAPALHAVDLTTGTATRVGAVSGLNAGEEIRALAVPNIGGPATTQAAGDLVALAETNRLVSFQPGSPQKQCTSVAITGLQASENVLGIDLRPATGALVALGSSGRVYTLNADTGAATQLSLLAADAADVTAPFAALAGAQFGVDVNPVPDRLRVVSDTGQNLRINMDTGATTTDTDLNPAGSAVTSAAYTNAFAGAGSTALYVLDATGDRLMFQGQPSGNPNNGDLQAVGALGIDIGQVTGFDIDGRNSTAYAAVSVGAATTSDLYTIDLATGTATRVNTVAGGARVRGLALTRNPTVSVLGITEDARLVSFVVGTPGTLTTNVAITGLGAAETIVGADRRPANGRVVVLTNTGALYTLNTTTGAVTAGPALAADVADLTDPYAGLSGMLFGVDFNPVPDRLRVVSNLEQNLRINVDTGVTITDAALNPGTPDVVAAAYARNFAGTTTTTLYVIDVATGTLNVQNPPNNGTLVPVGVLDAATTFVGGTFDIAGGADGLALAALAPTGATQSTLYRVNLSTGAATSLGAVGPMGTQPLRALVLEVR